MNLSRKWLNEFVTVTVGDKEFAEDMTLSGSKVETWTDLGAEIEKVVVGKVLELHRHENSDHMWVCSVDVGAAEPIQIVTGAQNVKAGDLVPAALDGARLPGGNLAGATPTPINRNDAVIAEIKTIEIDFEYVPMN